MFSCNSILNVFWIILLLRFSVPFAIYSGVVPPLMCLTFFTNRFSLSSALVTIVAVSFFLLFLFPFLLLFFFDEDCDCDGVPNPAIHSRDTDDDEDNDEDDDDDDDDNDDNDDDDYDDYDDDDDDVVVDAVVVLINDDVLITEY